MKTLWCVGLVLLLAVPVGAADKHDWEHPGEPTVTINCGFQGGKVCTEKLYDAIPCLAQMEAAMRAVAQFLAKAFLDGTGRIKSPGYTEKGKAELERAYQQWDTAKRDCWRTP